MVNEDGDRPLRGQQVARLLDGIVDLTETGSSIRYTLNFVGNGTAADPQFLLESAAEADNSLNGNSYILAVRTSATWRSQTTMAVNILDAQMIDPRTGRFCWGDRLTIADICLVAHLTSAKMLCNSDPAPYPTARRIFDACMQIEAFALEHPLRQAGAQTTAPL